MSGEEYDSQLWPLNCSWIYPRDEKQKKILKVLVICAHPDDADLLTGGLTLKLTSRGHKVKYVSLTNGNLGHYEKDQIDLAEIRQKEAQASAKILGAEYTSLNIDDGHVYVNREQTEKVVRVIREFDPDLVITHRPYDYHRDHRYTGQLVMDASYMLIVPHYCSATPISKTRKMPVICYAYDDFQKPYPFIPNIMLDITEEYSQKSAALINHESQMMDWLPWTLNFEEQIPEDYDIQNRLEILEMLIISVFSRIITDYRKLWKKAFPGKRIKKAEAFELCEYGRQPSVQELKELFPGAYIPSKKELEEFRK
ncbi:MAG: PIG-L family deacetylase [Candidatus Lokiarchaeota archaeon]|nr:PIG-L family deacetylase [Candidatus Harpocratesius repetitus]